jgi:hypothetical protein
MDSKQFESIGEATAVAALLEAGILVTKPAFDRMGADLIGFNSIGDDGRFCRIQCKYRNLGDRTSVVLPVEYVTGAFVMFLHLKTGGSSHNFCFLPADIEVHFKRGHQKSNAIFRLMLAEKTLVSLSSDASLQFSEAKVSQLLKLMRTSSPVAQMWRDYQKVIQAAEKLEEVRSKRERLQSLLHEHRIANLKKEAADDQLKLMGEYIAYVESQQPELKM